jgi:Spy/CpxP family protein refolding chaperone
MDDVDATDAQRAHANRVKEAWVAAAQPVLREQDKVSAELAAQWASDKPDAARIHQVIDEQVKAYSALLHKAADGAVEMHGVLNAEQRAELGARMRHR